MRNEHVKELFKRLPVRGYETPRAKKKHITKLARPYRIGLFVDRTYKRAHNLAQWVLGINRRRDS